jgi:hypothetical protein
VDDHEEYSVPLIQNVSICWEMNFYDKNTKKGKRISEQNEFSPKYIFGAYIWAAIVISDFSIENSNSKNNFCIINLVH